MALLRRRSSQSLSVEELRVRAEKSAALAKRDAAAVRFAEEAALCQLVVAHNADEIQRRIDAEARWTAESEAIAAKLRVAQRTVLDLSDRIDNARTATDDALKQGLVGRASEHGMAIGSMQLTLVRAQAILQELEQEYADVPRGDVTDQERALVPVLRAIALSPKKSHAHVVPKLTLDPTAELRALGRSVAKQQCEHPTFHQTPTPMRDLRAV